MKKNELVKSISEKSGFSKKDSELALETIIDSIVEAVSIGESVKIVGFGTFSSKEFAARVGSDPRNKEKINIPAKKRVMFKVGKDFKRAVNDE